MKRRERNGNSQCKGSGQCQGIEELFSQKYAQQTLSSYRERGPDRTTKILTGILIAQNIKNLTLLDIGSGVGAVGHVLLQAGVRKVTNVEASSAFLQAAEAEASRRGLAEAVCFHEGDFVDLAGQIEPADIVTLDRVICCYDDMEKLVGLSSARARKYYGLVYPRDNWWIRIWLGIENFYFRIKRTPFRAFSYSTQAVESVLERNGFKRSAYRQTSVWQVAVYSRQSSA